MHGSSDRERNSKSAAFMRPWRDVRKTRWDGSRGGWSFGDITLFWEKAKLIFKVQVKDSDCCLGQVVILGNVFPVAILGKLSFWDMFFSVVILGQVVILGHVFPLSFWAKLSSWEMSFWATLSQIRNCFLNTPTMDSVCVRMRHLLHNQSWKHFWDEEKIWAKPICKFPHWKFKHFCGNDDHFCGGVPLFSQPLHS